MKLSRSIPISVRFFAALLAVVIACLPVGRAWPAPAFALRVGQEAAGLEELRRILGAPSSGLEESWLQGIRALGQLNLPPRGRGNGYAEAWEAAFRNAQHVLIEGVRSGVIDPEMAQQRQEMLRAFGVFAHQLVYSESPPFRHVFSETTQKNRDTKHMLSLWFYDEQVPYHVGIEIREWAQRRPHRRSHSARGRESIRHPDPSRKNPGQVFPRLIVTLTRADEDKLIAEEGTPTIQVRIGYDRDGGVAHLDVADTAGSGNRKSWIHRWDLSSIFPGPESVDGFSARFVNRIFGSSGHESAGLEEETRERFDAVGLEEGA